MEEELARAMPPPSDCTAPPPPPSDCNVTPPECSVPPPPNPSVPVPVPAPVVVKGKGRPKGRRGATVSTRRYLKDTSAGERLRKRVRVMREGHQDGVPAANAAEKPKSTAPVV